MKGVHVSDGESCRSLRPARIYDPQECNGIFTLLIHFISIKREIGHLCHDESKSGKQNTTAQPQMTAPALASLASASGMSTSFGSPTAPCTSPLPLFLHDHGACVAAVYPICSATISHFSAICYIKVDADVVTLHVATAPPYSAAVTPVPSWPGISAPQSTYLYPTESFGRDFSSLS